MKRILWLTLTAAVIATGYWTARAVWRAKQDIVSLHVRNAPLAKVIRQLEGQSREIIVAGQELTGSITLDFDNLPLTEALARVGEQAGGLPGAIHTVYRSERELQELKTTLAAGRGPAPEAWTNLAPNFHAFTRPDDAEGVAGDPSWSSAVGGGGQFKVLGTGDLPPEVQAEIASAMKQAGAEGAQRGTVTIRMDDKEMKAGDPDQGAQAQPGSAAPVGRVRQKRVMTLRLDGNQLKSGDLDRVLKEQLGTNASVVGDAVASAVAGALGGLTNGTLPHGAQVRSFSTGPVITMKRSGPGAHGEAETDFWSPERIILEMSLEPRLGGELPENPSRAEADQVARKVQGRCVTLYALQPSLGAAMSVDLLRQFKPGSGGSGRVRLAPDTEGTPNLERLTGEVEARIQRESLEQFQKLTPEQRAERARARQSSQTNR